MTAGLSGEQRALQQVISKAPMAFWKGLIAAAKTTPLVGFGLTFLSELQGACRSIWVEQRKDVALALRRARCEDIEAELKLIGLEQAETRATLAQVLKSIAEIREF